MRTHFHAEMADIEQAVVRLAETVRGNIEVAVQSLAGQDRDKAVAAMRADHAVDLQEVRNEEACLKVIALHQPVADDLRYLIVLNKANHDLERISDLAAKIAASVLTGEPTETSREWSGEIGGLTRDVGRRLELVVNALSARDGAAARRIWASDVEVNEQCRQWADKLRTAIVEKPADGAALFALLAAVGHVERMADHVKNIAKDVIYLVSGEIARHRSSDLLPIGDDRKIRVLFACVHNSARSQMAEAWLNHLHGDRFEACSAGLEPGRIHPLTVQAMREVGLDLSDKKSTDVYERLRRGESYDYLITVCDEAQAQRCPPALGLREEIHWSFSDPSALEGNEDERLQAVRDIRDAIRRRVSDWAQSLLGAS
jgi:arsenate reductase (thioredoxin)